MVGYSAESDTSLHVKDYLTAGAVSGFITRCLFQPLDVLKIRFQLQIEPIKASSPSSKYKSIAHAVKLIYMEEGVRAFWKGLVPAQCLSVGYGAFQFLSFELLTKQAWFLLPTRISEDFKPAVNFSCGALAGCIATVGSFPFDVVRTRLVGQGEPKIYRGVIDAAVKMMYEEGPRSYFRGLLPTLIQIAPNAGAQFAFYKLFEELWNITFRRASNSPGGAVQVGLCGAAAGIAAKTAVYPLDLIKKRLQVQGFEKARKSFGMHSKYTGFLNCAFTIVKEEGVLGMYKGLSPSIWKAAFTTGSHFLFYEEVCKLLSYIHR